MILTLLSALTLIAAPSWAHTGSEDGTSALELTWADLMPEGSAQRLAELQQLQALTVGMDHFGTDRMPQVKLFDTVPELDGQTVRIGGYVLPFDFARDNKVSRFLLVPYVGACIHVPPPPPNQLIYVTSEEPVEIEGLWDPVFVTGTLRTESYENDLGDTAYILELTEVRPYER